IKSDRDLKGAGADPGIQSQADRPSLCDVEDGAHGQHERHEHCRNRDPVGAVSDPMAEQADDDERCEWEERDERVLHGVPAPGGSCRCLPPPASTAKTSLQAAGGPDPASPAESWHVIEV